MKERKEHTISDLLNDMSDAVYQKYQSDLYSIQSCPEGFDVDVMEENKLRVFLLQSGVSCRHHQTPPKVPKLDVCDRMGQPAITGLNQSSNFPAFIFVQPSPTGVWLIQHNLGYNPLVRFKDTLGNPIFGTIEYVNANTLRVTFTSLEKGTAFLYPN